MAAAGVHGASGWLGNWHASYTFKGRESWAVDQGSRANTEVRAAAGYLVDVPAAGAAFQGLPKPIQHPKILAAFC